MSQLQDNSTALATLYGKIEAISSVGGVVLPELSNEGTAAELLSGKQLIDSVGNKVTGTMPNGSAKTPATTITKNPTITVSTNGKITATVSGTQSVTPTIATGYVASGTAGTITVTGTTTSTLTTAGATTITPGTANKTAVSAYRYTTGTVTVKGDANLVAANIKTGTSIFGVTGTFTSDATATSAQILSGKTAYVKGAKVTGIMPNNGAVNQTIAPGASYTIPAGYHNGSGKVTASNSGGGGGSASNDTVYVRVKAESPVTDATIHYTAPDGNVHTIITDNLEGDLQEFEAAAGSAIYIDSYAYLTYTDFPIYATNGDNMHFCFVEESIGPDDYHEIIFDEL